MDSKECSFVSSGSSADDEDCEILSEEPSSAVGTTDPTSHASATDASKSSQSKTLSKIERLREKEKRKEDRRRHSEELQQRRAEKEQRRAEKEQLREAVRAKRLEQQEQRNKAKQLRDEEKRQQQMAKEKLEKEKAEKQKQLFAFFTRSAEPERDKDQQGGKSQFFKPFELKQGMVLAPTLRWTNVGKTDVSQFDNALLEQNVNQMLYLVELKQGLRKPGSWPQTVPAATDVSIISSVATYNYGKRKLLQFCEDRRPAKYGYWTKKSNKITGRRPFNQDQEIFDYEVDSDDEWEEPEGDECKSDEEDEGSDDGDDDDDSEDESKFFVEHGYLSASEQGSDEENLDPEARRERSKAKLLLFQEDLESRRSKRFHSIILGPFCPDSSINDEGSMKKLNEFETILLTNIPAPTSFTPDLIEHKCYGTPVTSTSAKRTPSQSFLKRPVPVEAMPYLVNLIHLNRAGIDTLIKEFQAFWKSKTIGDSTTCDPSVTPSSCTISKRQLELTIREIAVREKRDVRPLTCWYVRNDVLVTYPLSQIAGSCESGSTCANDQTTAGCPVLLTEKNAILTARKRLRSPTGATSTNAADAAAVSPASKLPKCDDEASLILTEQQPVVRPSTIYAE